MHLKSHISLLLAALTLVHGLLAFVVLVYINFALHQDQIANELCTHQSVMDDFCKGDGICQLQLKLQQVEEGAQSEGQQVVKKMLIDQIFLPSEPFLYIPIFKRIISVFTQVQTLLPQDYFARIDSPPRIL